MDEGPRYKKNNKNNVIYLYTSVISLLHFYRFIHKNIHFNLTNVI